VSDRELLELAAKAAGIDYSWKREDHCVFWSYDDRGEVMSDRELLELAAKAAGMEYIKPAEGYDGKLGLATDGHPMRTQSWNPLTDDGDALRLAVKLGLTVSQWMNNREVEVNDYDETVFVNEFHEPDPCVTTRRAIVRAAAKIGRNKT